MPDPLDISRQELESHLAEITFHKAKKLLRKNPGFTTLRHYLSNFGLYSNDSYLKEEIIGFDGSTGSTSCFIRQDSEGFCCEILSRPNKNSSNQRLEIKPMASFYDALCYYWAIYLSHYKTSLNRTMEARCKIMRPILGLPEPISPDFSRESAYNSGSSYSPSPF